MGLFRERGGRPGLIGPGSSMAATGAVRLCSQLGHRGGGAASAE
jgi:hypothetical protein